MGQPYLFLEKVFIAGDMVRNTDVLLSTGAGSAHLGRMGSKSSFLDRGAGALFLYEVLRELFSQLHGPPAMEVLLGPNAQRDAATIWTRTGTLNSARWRVERLVSVSRAVRDPRSEELVMDNGKEFFQKYIEDRVPSGKYSVLIIADHGLGFASEDKHDPARRELIEWANSEDVCRVVLKSRSAAMFQTPLWNMLVKECADKSTLICTWDDITRAHGTRTRATYGWDARLSELNAMLSSVEGERTIARIGQVLVLFGARGLAGIKNGSLDFVLANPNESANSFSDARAERTLGSLSVVTAAYALGIARGSQRPQDGPYLRGMAISATLFDLGFVAGFDEDRAQPLDSVFSLSEEPVLLAKLLLADGKALPAACKVEESRFRLLEQPFASETARKSMLEIFCGPQSVHYESVASSVVRVGIEKALDGIPRVAFGKFASVDPKEISALLEVAQRLNDYALTETFTTPLCLAVFGPPGSGKSFLIKELTQAVFGSNSEILERNLSQFGDGRELQDIFEEIRDTTISGRLPVVIWDEFDSQDYRWLMHFLSPMWDGEYSRPGRTKPMPFGRAVFAFSGGVNHSTEDFNSFVLSKDGEGKKAPDFKSRLVTSIDVLPVNASRGSIGGLSHLIKRALVLRSTIEKYYPHLVLDGRVLIENSVIQRFLRASKFAHDARSIQAVVKMSNLRTASVYGIENLPLHDFVDLHVEGSFGPSTETEISSWAEEFQIENIFSEEVARLQTAGDDVANDNALQDARWIIAELRSQNLTARMASENFEHVESLHDYAAILADRAINCALFNSLRCPMDPNPFVGRSIGTVDESLKKDKLQEWFKDLSMSLLSRQVVLKQ